MVTPDEVGELHRNARGSVAARTRFAELVDITDAIGGFTSFYALLDVELLAWQGEEDPTRAKLNELIESATALDSGSSVNYGLYAMAVLELGLGRYPEALTAAQELDAARTPSWSPYALPLIVETATRCEDVKAATEALGQIVDRTEARSRQRTRWA